MIIKGTSNNDNLVGEKDVRNDIYGRGGDDRIVSQNGHDHLEGGAGDDRILSGAGNDLVFGDAGADQIFGEEGDDFVFGGAASDRILGGAGDDYLSGDGGQDFLAGNDGDDSLDGGDGNDRLFGGGGDDQLRGNHGDDNLIGVAGNDVIFGGFENDRLLGGQGDDILHGDQNDDRLLGNLGLDALYGDEGDDSLDGGVDADTLFGGEGDDVLQGGQGEDRIYGGDDYDNINGGGNDDYIEAGNDHDLVRGGFGDDSIFGGRGDDVILAGRGDDFINAGTGDNYVKGELGDDTLIFELDALYYETGVTVFLGGDGADTAMLETSLADIRVTLIQANVLSLAIRDVSNVELRLADVENIAIGEDSFSFDDIAAMAVNSVALNASGGAFGEFVTAPGDVSAAGDVNGDGYDDLIFGDKNNDSGMQNGGGAFIVYGGSDGLPGDIDFNTLPDDFGFFVQGSLKFDLAGETVSTAGDINADGYDDVIVCAPRTHDRDNDAGKAYVIFGGPEADAQTGSGAPVVDLAALSPDQGFTIVSGQSDQAWLSDGAAPVGDMNGDGIDDFGLSAPLAHNDSGDNGEAYVIFGAQGLFGETVSSEGADSQILDVEALDANEGFVIKAEDQLATDRITPAGDINADGFDDLILDGADKAYVVFGSDDGFGETDSMGRKVIDLASMSPEQGFTLIGEEGAYGFANYVSSAGDINGDGFSDIAISSYSSDAAGENAGRVYVVYGAESGFGDMVDVSHLQAEDGFIMHSRPYDRFGPIASAGDINGDGLDDLLVRNGSEAHIIFGSAGERGHETADGQQVFDIFELSEEDGLLIRADGGAFQNIFAPAGDINADGLDDILIGVNFGESGSGYYVLYGAPDIAEGGSAEPAPLSADDAAIALAALQGAQASAAETANGGAPHGGASAPPTVAEMANFSDAMEATLARQLDEISGRLDDAFSGSGADAFSAGDGFGWL